MSGDRSSLAVLAEIEVSAVRVNTLVSSADDVSVAAVAGLELSERGEGGQTRIEEGNETREKGRTTPRW